MRRLVQRGMPDSLAGQVVLLLVVSVVGMHLLGTLAFLLDGRREPRPEGGPFEAAAFLVRLSAVPAGERPALLEVARVGAEDWSVGPAATAGGPVTREGPLARSLPDGFVVRRSPEGEPGLMMDVVTLPDGDRYAVRIARGSPPLIGPAVVTLLFLAVGIVLFGAWSVFAVTAPLRRFVAAVEAFGPTGATPLVEEGPREVRAAIAAFNRLQDRVGRLLDDNARMLGAVSHDLRTPITRLRLRAEFIEDVEMREAMLGDLDHVSALTADALAYLNGRRGGAKPERVDLASLVEATVDQFADLGQPVTFAGPERLAAVVRPNDLQRALRNLVENGLTYAGAVEVRLSSDPDGAIRIAVLDEGPGIPAADRDRMQRPFERGDEARTSDETSGFGLGLSIARAVAEAHGGRLELAERQPHGLAASIVLPPPGGAGEPAAG